MQPITSPRTQKLISTVATTAVSFLGFEILSLILEQTYQLAVYVRVSIYLYAFQVLWLAFIFDLHIRKRDIVRELRSHHSGLKLFIEAFKHRIHHFHNWSFVRHYLNYLILPGVIYWSAVFLMIINPFNATVKQFVICVTTICLGIIYWHLKEVFNKSFEIHNFGIRILILVKILTAYLFYAALLGYSFYFGMDKFFLFISIFSVTFLLLYQALFQRKQFSPKLFFIMLGISMFTGLVSISIYQIWNFTYLTGALVMLAFYNTCWGMLHHYLDNNLTKRLALEYLFLLCLAITVLLASHDFNPRIE